MKQRKKITAQSVNADTWSEVQAMHEETGVPYGRLVTTALELWLASLDPATPIPIQRQDGWVEKPDLNLG